MYLQINHCARVTINVDFRIIIIRIIVIIICITLHDYIFVFFLVCGPNIYDTYIFIYIYMYKSRYNIILCSLRADHTLSCVRIFSMAIYEHKCIHRGYNHDFRVCVFSITYYAVQCSSTRVRFEFRWCRCCR